MTRGGATSVKSQRILHISWVAKKPFVDRVGIGSCGKSHEPPDLNPVDPHWSSLVFFCSISSWSCTLGDVRHYTNLCAIIPYCEILYFTLFRIHYQCMPSEPLHLCYTVEPSVSKQQLYTSTPNLSAKKRNSHHTLVSAGFGEDAAGFGRRFWTIIASTCS